MVQPPPLTRSSTPLEWEPIHEFHAMMEDVNSEQFGEQFEMLSMEVVMPTDDHALVAFGDPAEAGAGIPDMDVEPFGSPSAAFVNPWTTLTAQSREK